jgi:hypothetical protein
MDRYRLEKGIRAAAACGFLLWSAAFLSRSSFSATDGHRYFSLFDDAMISMRYAWNFSHGHGLVWNAGNYIQGYTNLLMTLVMSLATFIFDKSHAVLFIQILGVFTTLAIAFQSMSLMDLMIDDNGRWKSYVRVAVFLFVLGYYPLAYWSLMGMETGLLTLLLLAALISALDYTRNQAASSLWRVPLYFGLAFLTRNDSLVVAALTFGFILWRTRRLERQFLLAVGWFSLLMAGQFLFQYLYYGEVLPNTYALKLTGIPLAVRLENGWRFTQPFLVETAALLALAALNIVLNPRNAKVLFGALILSVIGYQVYVGGDAWPYWRMISPVMPLVFILSADMLSGSVQRVVRDSPILSRAVYLVLIMAGIISVNWRFRFEITFTDAPFQVRSNRENVYAALALNEVTTSEATVAVFWAGSIPYYLDRYAIDPLGRTDRVIARLPADISGAAGWNGMTSVPGHNKYDLTYSIVQLRPTYVQYFQWGRQDLTEWAGENYVRAKYEDVELNLLRDSPDVLWERVELLE